MQIQRYVGRISGPLLDRIDIHIDVPAVRFKELTGDVSPGAESSAIIRERVMRAREQQRERFNGEGIFSNALMTPRLIRHFYRIEAESERTLEQAMARPGLSARAYDRILKVSRTIADLEGATRYARRTSPKRSAIVRSTAPVGLEEGLSVHESVGAAHEKD